MHARLATIQFHPGTLDEAVQLFRDSVVSDANQQPGFQGVLALVDRSTHKALSITLWQTEAEAQASATSGHLQAQITKFASYVTAPPVIETFEVAVELNPQPLPPIRDKTDISNSPPTNPPG